MELEFDRGSKNRGNKGCSAQKWRDDVNTLVQTGWDLWPCRITPEKFKPQLSFLEEYIQTKRKEKSEAVTKKKQSTTVQVMYSMDDPDDGFCIVFSTAKSGHGCHAEMRGVESYLNIKSEDNVIESYRDYMADLRVDSPTNPYCRLCASILGLLGCASPPDSFKNEKPSYMGGVGYSPPSVVKEMVQIICEEEYNKYTEIGKHAEPFILGTNYMDDNDRSYPSMSGWEAFWKGVFLMASNSKIWGKYR